jgi:hypothetical protein
VCFPAFDEEMLSLRIASGEVRPPNLDQILDRGFGLGHFEERSHASFTSAEFPYTSTVHRTVGMHIVPISNR